MGEADLSATTAVNCRYPWVSNASEATRRYVKRRIRRFIAERRCSDLASNATYPSRGDGRKLWLSAALSTHLINGRHCDCEPCAWQHFFSENLEISPELICICLAQCEPSQNMGRSFEPLLGSSSCLPTRYGDQPFLVLALGSTGPGRAAVQAQGRARSAAISLLADTASARGPQHPRAVSIPGRLMPRRERGDRVRDHSLRRGIRAILARQTLRAKIP